MLTLSLKSPTGVSDPAASACELTSAISGCTESPATGGTAGKFHFSFETCRSPSVSSVSHDQGHAVQDVTLAGSGFGASGCQHKIDMGDFTCSVSSASAGSLVCNVDGSTKPQVCSCTLHLKFNELNSVNLILCMKNYRGSTCIIVKIIVISNSERIIFSFKFICKSSFCSLSTGWSDERGPGVCCKSWLCSHGHPQGPDLCSTSPRQLLLPTGGVSEGRLHPDHQRWWLQC